jgi:hypothetical protein
MKILIALGVGIALGFAFKKPEKIKEAKFVIVDNRQSFSDYLHGPDAKKAFVKFFNRSPENLSV